MDFKENVENLDNYISNKLIYLKSIQAIKYTKIFIGKIKLRLIC